MSSCLKRLLLMLCTLTLQVGIAQNRAPSCWLKYQDAFQGDILINKVKVSAPSPTYSYYWCLQWNAGMEGGGYCGIQEHPNGRNFIFSIWDPISSSEAITAPYTHPTTIIESFGGEGTGLKSWNFDIGWDTEQWYSFVTRAWPSGSSTMFGFWVFNHTDQEWYHLVTMDYPVSNIRFNSSTGSFIEDWLGNGWNTREVHHQEGWKRRTSNYSWQAFTSCTFERVRPDAGANNYIDNYNGGTHTDSYFMQSGGNITPTTSTTGTTLTLANSNSTPEYHTGQITSLNTTTSLDSLHLTWTLDSSKAPQFSYDINIYDNPDFLGNPVIEINENIPHQRNHNIDVSTLTKGKQYYLKLSIHDIFDNQSAVVTDRFLIESIVHTDNTNPLRSLSYYPNPFRDNINLKFSHRIKFVKISVADSKGRVMLTNDYYNCSEIEQQLPANLDAGLYFLTVTDHEQNTVTITLHKK